MYVERLFVDVILEKSILMEQVFSSLTYELEDDSEFYIRSWSWTDYLSLNVALWFHLCVCVLICSLFALLMFLVLYYLLYFYYFAHLRVGYADYFATCTGHIHTLTCLFHLKHIQLVYTTFNFWVNYISCIVFHEHGFPFSHFPFFIFCHYDYKKN